MKFRKILAYLRLILLNSGLICFLIGLFFQFLGYQKIADILLMLASILSTFGFIAIILYFIFFISKTQNYRFRTEPKKIIRTVDVKEVPKTKEEKLYEQYEELYKKNLISLEDLNKKKEELLGKK